MKTKQIFIPLIAIFIFSLTTCKKETITEPTPTPTSTLSADSNYLSKILVVNKFGSQLDTFARLFTFDNLKRVTEIQDNYSNSNTFYQIIKFTYNSSDLLPSKRVVFSIGANRKDTSTSFLSYNANGELTIDSTIISTGNIPPNPSYYLSEKRITNYTFNTNKVYGNIAYTTLFSSNGIYSSSLEKDTSTLDANKNIIDRKSTRTINGSPNIIKYNGIFTYDNNPSPYKVLNIASIFPVPNTLDQEQPAYNMQGAKNARLISSESQICNCGLSANNSANFTNKYTFKSNGFPEIILVPSTPSTDFTKIIFIYRTL
jgi:hypothetical protein